MNTALLRSEALVEQGRDEHKANRGPPIGHGRSGASVTDDAAIAERDPDRGFVTTTRPAME
jgi:hypothetical protein